MEIDVNAVTLIAGGIGATGSIAGAIAGALLGIKLSNTKPDIDVFVDHKAWMYYPSRGFAMY